MNLLLLDPFRTKFPDTISGALPSRGFALCVAVGGGHLLATGTHEGSVAVWDVATREPARVFLGAHSRPVSCVALCLAPNVNANANVGGGEAKGGDVGVSRKKTALVLSGSLDGSVAVHDILAGALRSRLDFDAPVLQVSPHPQDGDLALVVSFLNPTALVRLSTGERWALPEAGREEALARNGGAEPELPIPPTDADKVGSGSKVRHIDANFRRMSVVPTSVATFNETGSKIYIGNAAGVITVIDTATRTEDTHFSVSPHANAAVAVRSIRFSRAVPGMFLVNSTDKIIRMFRASDHTVAQSFEDYVNHTPWRQCCFSYDGEYVLAATAAKSAHSIQCYSRATGNLYKSLEGNIKEGMLDMVWHPTRPVIVTLSSSGVVYLWTPQFQENWSAFAPDFQELQENEEYIEREDEFDISDETTGMPEARAGTDISITAAIYGTANDNDMEDMVETAVSTSRSRATRSLKGQRLQFSGRGKHSADAPMLEDEEVDVVTVERYDPVPDASYNDEDELFFVPFDIPSKDALMPDAAAV